MSPNYQNRLFYLPQWFYIVFQSFFYTFSLYSVNLGSKRGSKIIKIGIVVVEDREKKSDFANFWSLNPKKFET